MTIGLAVLCMVEAVQNRGKGLASPRGILPFTMRGAVVPRVA